MALSGNAARALQQVEMGLYMLYGASYFTEDEWIKLDSLIHKGQYVFTTGPAQHNFLDDELMSFDDSNVGHATPANASFGLVNHTAASHTPPTSSSRVEKTPTETSTEPSVRTSSEDGSAKKYELFDFSETTTPSSAGASSIGTQKLSNDMFEFSERKTPSPVSVVHADQQTWSNELSDFSAVPEQLTKPQESIPEQSVEQIQPTAEPTSESLVHDPISASTVQISTKSFEPIIQSSPAPVEPVEAIVEPSFASDEPALPFNVEPFEPPKREVKPIPKEGGLAYYTQAQLDELKAFNAGLTKAGEKSKSGKPKRGERREDYGYEEPSQYTLEEAPLPQEISYEPVWADTISPTATEHDTRIQSWASEVNAQDTEVASQARQEIASPIRKPDLVEKFVEVHGRIPKCPNDIAQPNNPNFRTLDQRSVSRASNGTSIKSSSRIVSPAPKRGPGNPELNVVSGTVLIAQSGFKANSKIQIDVQPGDKIRVIKHVSGTTHVGETLRNGIKGQFPESVFKRAPGQNASTLLEQQRVIARKAPSMVSMGPEVMNAADWEAESVISKARPTPISAKPAGGLSTSRYAILDDLASAQQKQVEELARLEVGKLVDERVAQILAANSRTGIKAPVKEALQVVPPKTETCWWWKTPGKGCRFTSHECRDAHYYLPPTPGEAANLRMGKPTWGALADQIPASPAPPSAPSYSTSTSKTGLKTCWYWENDTCTNSAEDCKYLHEHSSAGVAPKPHHTSGWKRTPTMRNWRSNMSVNEGSMWSGDGTVAGDGEGELVLEEVKDGEDWGASVAGESASDDWGLSSNTYKAPHVRALEERASIAVNGW